MSTRPSRQAEYWLIGTASVTTLAMAIWLLVAKSPSTPVREWIAICGSAVTLIGLILAKKKQTKQHSTMATLDARLRQSENECNRLLEELHLQGRLEHELLVAKQAAEAAVLAKGSFLATMSHEIRTPLNGIIPMIDMVSRGNLAQDQREMLQTANESSLQLLRVLDDILDYSKLEVDKLELEITTFNLRDLMEGVTQLMKRAADAKRLTLHLHIDERVRLPVCGDPIRIRQVLSNLIGNAIKFTERGRIDIYLRPLGDQGAKHHLRFEIHDTGIGISTEQQKRLFAAFSQADASTTRLYGGTGLGLAICKRIVSLMDGKIGVKSQVGVGSNFWFELALSKNLDKVSGVQDGNIEPKLLLVSSDITLLKHISRGIAGHGMIVQTAQSSQEAMDHIERVAQTPQQFHVVVGDYSTLRFNARALQRIVRREYQDLPSTQMIWLQGEDAIATELLNDSEQISREAAVETLLANLAPKQRDPIIEPSTSNGTSLADSGSELPRHQARLLLVEDNPVNLAVAQKLLNALGYQADPAPNGEAALQKMEVGKYDLVFMDCQTPILDGYAATRRWRIREHELGGKRLPIVAMTANAMAGDRQRCLDAGMDDYMSKPIARSQLIVCLKRWLSPQEDKKTQEPKRDTTTPSPANGTPDNTSSDLPVLDSSTIDELYEIAGNETIDIIELFLKDAPESIASLQTGVAETDAETIRESAHKLKSSSANVGAKALSSAASVIETVARNNTLDSAENLVGIVVSEFARVRFALRLQIERIRKRAQTSSGD